VRRAFCDQEFQQKEKNGAPALRQIRTSRTRQLQLPASDRSYATACHSMLARWLDEDLRCAGSSSNQGSAMRRQLLQLCLPWPRCFATAASFPFPGHPTNPGSAEENHGMESPCRVQTISRTTALRTGGYGGRKWRFCV
jgi:hypothetical protein